MRDGGILLPISAMARAGQCAKLFPGDEEDWQRWQGWQSTRRRVFRAVVGVVLVVVGVVVVLLWLLFLVVVVVVVLFSHSFSHRHSLTRGHNTRFQQF